MTTTACERNPQLSIVVPIYNEEDNIEELIRRISEALNGLYSYEVVLVNDGSSDQSGAILDKVAEKNKRIKIIHFSRNFGQTAALMAGINASQGSILVPMDGDLQNDPNDIPKLIDTINQGYDVCSGWRKDRKDNPISRTIPSKLANGLISWISGVNLRDYGCTLKAYRRQVIEHVKLYGEMHRFVPIYATWFGAKVTEMAVTHHPRIHGKSKYGLNRIIKVVLDLIVVKFLTSYLQKPIYVFGGFGLASFAGSFLGFATMLYYKFFGHKTFIETPLPALVITLFLIGFISILMGLLAEMNVRIYHESQKKPIYGVSRTVNLDEETQCVEL